MKHRAWIVVSLLLAGCTASADEDAAENAPSATAIVQTAVAAVRPVELVLSAYGSVTPGPQAALNLSAARAGEVTSIAVLPGAAVKRGAPLLTFAVAPEAVAAYAQAEAAARAARSLYAQHLATNAQLAEAEANLAAQEKLGGGAAETTLRAPADGVVDALLVHVGDRVAENTALLSFAGTAAPFVMLGVDPEDAARIRPGMSIRVTAVFDATRRLETRVTEVGARVDEQSGLVEVMAPLPPKSAAGFMPGSAVTGEIELAESDTVAVPRSAVLHDAEGAYVFTVADGKAHRSAVTAGIDDGVYVAVPKGLKAGTRVVTLGNYELQDGMAVKEPKT